MITPEQIQLIVDGECSHESRALLLREMDTQPSDWRTLALALLEEQQWSRELITISTCANKHASGWTNHDDAVTQVQPLVSILNPAFIGSPIQKNSAAWLPALAATLLLGVGIYGGSWLPKFSNGKTTPETQFSAHDSKTNASDTLAPMFSTQESNMKMLVSGPNQEKSEIPVYDLNASDHDLFVAREIYEIAKINQRLRREGYELDVRPEFYTGKLNDGRNLIVPVKHVGVRQYGL